MSLSKKTYLTAALILTTLCVAAQQTAQKFIQEMPYLLYLPEGYTTSPSKSWPLVIFLHGSGESGTDIEKVKANGPPHLIAEGKQFPFIVMSPQNNGRGWRADVLREMLADVEKKYRVDKDRIYLTGLSMGGFGTWNMATTYPQLFAAIAPICGGGDASKAWRLKNVPIWCFHGAKDYVVPLSASQKMIDEVKPLNPDVKFTIYPETGHNSWVEAYNNDSLYTWLLSHKRHQHQEVPVAAALLKPYEGTFAAENRDTVKISIENGKLMARPPKATIELKPAGETVFFIDANAFDYVEFERKADGTVDQFVVAGEKKQVFRRVR